FQERPAFFSRVCSPTIWTMSAALRSSASTLSVMSRSLIGGVDSRQSIVDRLWMSSQLQDRRAVSALPLGGGLQRGNRGMDAEGVGDRLAEPARSVRVYDAQVSDSREKRGVERLLDFRQGILDSLADDVDLAGNQRDRFRLLGGRRRFLRRGLPRRLARRGLELGARESHPLSGDVEPARLGVER